MQTMLKRVRSEAAAAKLWGILLAAVLLVGGGWAVKTFYFEALQPKNILLMGVDEDKTRTDVVLLAHVDARHGIFNVVSIPRDTLVDIPCSELHNDACVTPDKLAHAHAYGGADGPKTTVQTVERFLGVKVDGYVRVDFDGFKGLIDQLGGVDLVIDKDMQYYDPTAHPPLRIDFTASKQPQHLSGDQALKYVRFRADGQGDIGRTERTRKFMVAVAQTVKQNGTLLKLPSLVTSMLPYVKTDLNSGTLAALARAETQSDPGHIQVSVIPGEPGTARGLWVWKADRAKTQSLVDSLIAHPVTP